MPRLLERAVLQPNIKKTGASRGRIVAHFNPPFFNCTLLLDLTNTRIFSFRSIPSLANCFGSPPRLQMNMYAATFTAAVLFVLPYGTLGDVCDCSPTTAVTVLTTAAAPTPATTPRACSFAIDGKKAGGADFQGDKIEAGYCDMTTSTMGSWEATATSCTCRDNDDCCSGCCMKSGPTTAGYCYGTPTVGDSFCCKNLRFCILQSMSTWARTHVPHFSY